MADITNFDRTDVVNMQTAVETVRDIFIRENDVSPANAALAAEFGELAERLKRVTTLSGEAF